jgi:hypothetical protein
VAIDEAWSWHRVSAVSNLVYGYRQRSQSDLHISQLNQQRMIFENVASPARPLVLEAVNRKLDPFQQMGELWRQGVLTWFHDEARMLARKEERSRF